MSNRMASSQNSENLYRYPTKAYIISYTFMCYSWLFDFRSDGAGAGVYIQQFFIISFAISMLVFVVTQKLNGIYIRGVYSTISLSILFLIVGTISGLISDQDIYPIFRNALSVFIYASMVYCTAKFVSSVSPKFVVSFFMMAVFLYSISTILIYYIQKGEIDFSTIRFQIIGSSAVAAIALIPLSFRFKIPIVGYIGIFISSSIIFVSVTRSYIFILIAQIFPFSINVRRSIGPRALMFIVLAVFMISTLLISNQFQSDRWDDRINNSDNSEEIDPTVSTRLSEWKFMIDQTFNSPGQVFFGSGFGARTSYEVPKSVGGGTEFDIGFGHSNHISMIFIAGFFGGGPLLILLAYQFLVSFKFINTVVRGNFQNSDMLFLTAWGSLIVIGTFVGNIAASAFTMRSSSLWYAIGTGLFLGGRACFEPSNRRLLLQLVPKFHSQAPIVVARPRPAVQQIACAAGQKSQRLPAAALRRQKAMRTEKSELQ